MQVGLVNLLEVAKMLLEHMLACALIGLITAGIISLIVGEGKNAIAMFFMLLFGATFGWITGMVFIYATGGLELSIPWLILPFITTAFASTIMLYKFKNIGAIFTRPAVKADRIATIFSVVIFFALIGSLVIMALPQGYASSYNTQAFSAKNMDYENTVTTLSSTQASHLNTITPTGLVPITFDIAKSSVSGLRIAETPNEAQYLEFQLTFSVGSGGGNWEQPYIGMCVVQDTNGNGEPDAGETIWNDGYYKGPTQSGKWRANCMYDTSGDPVIEIFVASVGSDILLMPIFHANTITSWKTDSSHTFPNTPQGYTPPNDMISWEVSSSGALTLKEEITAFASVSAGSSVTFKGKIYCPDGSTGTHLLLVRAFDLRYTNPFVPNEDPLDEHIMTFAIGSGNGPVCGNGVCEPGETAESCPEDCGDGNGGYPDVDVTSESWVAVAVLGLGTIGGAAVVINRGPKLLKLK